MLSSRGLRTLPPTTNAVSYPPQSATSYATDADDDGYETLTEAGTDAYRNDSPPASPDRSPDTTMRQVDLPVLSPICYPTLPSRPSPALQHQLRYPTAPSGVESDSGVPISGNAYSSYARAEQALGGNGSQAPSEGPESPSRVNQVRFANTGYELPRVYVIVP